MDAKPGSLLTFLSLILSLAVIAFLVLVVANDKAGLSNDTLFDFAKNILQARDETSEQEETTPEAILPFKPGERLTYVVSFKRFKIGKAILTFTGVTELDGQEVYLVTFDTDTAYFRDLERIYAQKKTFLPLRVERKVSRLGGFSQRIVEEYDQQDFTVAIDKKGFAHKQNDTITKTSPIDNAILLSYIYRAYLGRYTQQKYAANLPTKEFNIFFSGKEEVSVPFGKSIAYIFESEPPQFKLWIKDDERRIPLMIEDPQVFGYALKLKSVEQEVLEDSDQRTE